MGLQDEELKIETGYYTVTIHGNGLGRLADALDAGALEIIRESAIGVVLPVENAIVVQSLIIEKRRQPYSLTGADTEGRRVKAE